MKGPMDCLVNTDFTNVCQSSESAVRSLADKWRQNFYDDVCQEGEETMVCYQMIEKLLYSASKL